MGARQLAGWYSPPATPTTPILIVAHGWGSSAALMLPLIAPLHAAGYGILAYDARCHGHSDDDSYSALPRFAEDLDASAGLAGGPARAMLPRAGCSAIRWALPPACGWPAAVRVWPASSACRRLPTPAN